MDVDFRRKLKLVKAVVSLKKPEIFTVLLRQIKTD